MHTRPIRSPQADFFFWLSRKLGAAVDRCVDWLLDRIRARLRRIRHAIRQRSAARRG